MRGIAAGVAVTMAITMVVERATAASLATQLDDLLTHKGFQQVDTIVPTLVGTRWREAPTSRSPRPVRTSPTSTVPKLAPSSEARDRSTQSSSRYPRPWVCMFSRLGYRCCGAVSIGQDGGLLRNTKAGFTFTGTTPENETVPIPGNLTFNDFRIEDFVFSGVVTYGITERWDVGLVVPAVLTTLKAQGRSTVRIAGENLLVTLDRFDIDDSKLGVGDVLLRTKYALDPLWGITFAPVFVLRLPTGNPNNFQGIGDTTLTPGVAAMHSGERVGFYADAGFEFDADDLSRSAFRYGMALSVRILKYASIIAELTGKSTVSDDTFSVRLAGTSRELPASILRSDIVSGAVSVKARVLPGCVAYAGALFPLTKDGVTTPVTPLAGLEFHF